MPNVADLAVGLNDSQRANARVIEREALASGLSLTNAAIAAMITNAWAESRLNHLASGDNGRSIGLFQLHEKGAGSGMSVAERSDPATNTRRILKTVASSYGKRFLAAMRASGNSVTDIAELAAIFSTDVERPANASAQELKRKALAISLFPSGTSAALVPNQNMPRSNQSAARWWWVLSMVGVGVVGFSLTQLRR
jgi:hypothetical protein